MKKSIVTMGMTATILIVDKNAENKDIEEVFTYFNNIDNVFSPYKLTSEISQINKQVLSVKNASEEMKYVLELCADTTKMTNGYFAIERHGEIDPSGIVKGYAIHQGAEILRKNGYKNFFITIAGDAEVAGKNEKGEEWRIGVQNPFSKKEIIKVIHLSGKGVATSGNYMQGKHIYNPLTGNFADEIASITVIGPNGYEADRFATAAFAMGDSGINFIENLSDFEGYMIRKDKTAVMTTGFDKFVL